MLKTVTSYSSGRNLLNVLVLQKGMTLTIGPGEVKEGDTTLDFPEAFQYTAQSHAEEAISVSGHLVVRKTTGELELLVDEIGGDFQDRPYVFEPDGPYRRVGILFWFKMPPKTETLDDVEITVIDIVKREPASQERKLGARPARKSDEKEG